ncbi:UDP-N-acetylmuramate--L-alanine ligase, partial [bacterium]
MDLSKIKKVHLIGVGGIGMSAVAKFMLKMGVKVSGSDAGESEVIQEVREKGVVIFIGHDEKNIHEDVDLIIYSLAVPENNPERKRAKELGITEMSYPQFLGTLSRQMKTVAVSGTNGKSTTTAIAGIILQESGLDPTVIVGSKVKNFEDGNLRVGGSGQGIFIVEACEYKEAMLNLTPEIIVLTNIEADHLDYYKDLEHIKRTFAEYVKLGKKIIVNADDEISLEILEKAGILGNNVLSYGVEDLSADVVAKNLQIKDNLQVFDLVYKNENLGEIQLQIPGDFNIHNALAAISVAILLKVPFEDIQKSIKKFRGICRRFEIIEKHEKTVVISDYAHHPTSVQGTIRAAKEFYPHQRIVAVFQPHSWNRTKNLFDKFANSFNEADLVILSEVFYVKGREDIVDKVSSKDLMFAVNKNTCFSGLSCKKTFYAENLKRCYEIIKDNLQNNDVVLLMGAGDIFKMGLLLG